MPAATARQDSSSRTRLIRLALGALVRRAPGGSSLLRLRRRSVAATRRRVKPVRPQLNLPEEIGSLSAAPLDHSFITGNGLAARCRYVINYDDLVVNADVENDWWFCRSDFLEYFFAEHEPKGEFVLFSHNSDRAIDRSLSRFLRRRALRAWFATNAATLHPKLRAFPCGIANPKWPHGNGAAIARVQSAMPDKTNLFDASYDVSTFPPAREYCRDQTGIEPAPRQDFDQYLHTLASSYFCIAPRGHGIDTHRIWEALYLRTIPIVTRSVLTEQHPDLPMIVLDDWAEFRRMEFSPDVYAETFGDWQPEALNLGKYMAQVEAILVR